MTHNLLHGLSQFILEISSQVVNFSRWDEPASSIGKIIFFIFALLVIAAFVAFFYYELYGDISPIEFLRH